MKLSVSLSADDVEFLDAYAAEHGVASRSAAVAAAVTALRQAALRDEYERAFTESDRSEDAALWDRTTSDGL
jgi:metal-responsive CopG/Arc/MetJ family transcriptional regulator